MPQHDPYVVIARRYRPQTFDDLIGQRHVTETLKSAIDSGRVGHAYLFTGARGVGKTSAARILAKAINCAQGPTSTPCNDCDVCRSVSSGEDVDVLEIDGASNRGIDEIRQLRRNVAMRASRARYKIYIIDEVHMLTKEAFNALLKTLEEPPEHVKFIFATTEPHKVPITILSRCQRFDFAGIDAAAIQEQLGQIATAEGVDAEEDALQILARRAAGSMRDGQSLLEQLLAGRDGKITAADVVRLLGVAPAVRLAAIALRLAEKDAAGALGELDASIREGADVGQLLEQMLGFFRDVMVSAVGCNADQMLHALPSQFDDIERIAKQLGVQTLLAVLQILEQTLARMRTSVDLRTLAEMCLVRIARLEDLDELGAVIQGLREAQPATVRPSAAASKKNVLADEPISRQPAPPLQTPQEEPNGVSREALPINPESIDRLWQQAVSSLDGMLRGQASKAHQIDLEGERRFVARFPRNYASCKSFCDEPEQRRRLEAALADAAGGSVELVLKLAAGESREPPPTSYRSRREVRQEVGQRPFVKEALELFGGEAAEFKYRPPDDG